jgi:hypothetical protein
MTDSILLAGPDEAADLSGYLERLLRFDKAAAVRLVADDAAVGVYGRPPSFEVLTLRTFGLAAQASVDVTLSAGQLLDGIASDGLVRLPAALSGATTWAGFLPPRNGWARQGELPAAEIETLAVAGIAEFKTRAEAIPDTERTRAVVDALAAEIWDARVSLGVPVRAAHAARAMAFLGQTQSADVAVSAAGRWLRLDATYGSVIVRTGGGLL